MTLLSFSVEAVNELLWLYVVSVASVVVVCSVGGERGDHNGSASSLQYNSRISSVSGYILTGGGQPTETTNARPSNR